MIKLYVYISFLNIYDGWEGNMHVNSSRNQIAYNGIILTRGGPMFVDSKNFPYSQGHNLVQNNFN